MRINGAYLIIFLILIFLLIIKYLPTDLVYQKSSIDNKDYLVRKMSDKENAANLLAEIRIRIFKFIDLLYNDKEEYPEKKKYIEQLKRRIKGVIISESPTNSEYVSYSVDKGEEISLCLRSKKILAKFHNINLIMYVVLHELAHVATPEIGHTPLFKEVFAFFAEYAVKKDIYKKIDFAMDPTEYCGLILTTSII